MNEANYRRLREDLVGLPARQFNHYRATQDGPEGQGCLACRVKAIQGVGFTKDGIRWGGGQRTLQEYLGISKEEAEFLYYPQRGYAGFGNGEGAPGLRGAIAQLDEVAARYDLAPALPHPDDGQFLAGLRRLAAETMSGQQTLVEVA